tara:strand:- start:6972 stop:7934 length:963 start_codon:yes stop_codon:yes gene_type:complete
MGSIKNLPVLILGYNRFDKFSRCINTLYEQGIKKVYVSIDGPLNVYDRKAQENIRNFCKSNSLDLDIKLKILSKNYGCRNGPINGISWFFEENKYGVILEDDVILSKNCIEIFSFLLEENLLNRNIMSLSSFNEFTNKNIESLYSISVWRSWGWASWADRWKMHIEFSKKIKNFSIFQLYNLLPEELRKIETAELIKSCQINMMDAWDYEFNFTHLVNNKKSLTLGGINNYVYGFDSSATHTSNIENIGIDFSLFKERQINKEKVLKIDKVHDIATLEKCGFSNSINRNKIYLLRDILKGIYYLFIFYLRKIKRNIYINF